MLTFLFSARSGLDLNSIGLQVWQNHQDLKEIQDAFGQDAAVRRLDVFCSKLNATMRHINEFKKITKHLYVLTDNEGKPCPSNLMLSGIIYDMGSSIRRHGYDLMHASKSYTLKINEIALRHKKSEEDDVQVLFCKRPGNISAVVGANSADIAGQTTRESKTSTGSKYPSPNTGAKLEKDEASSVIVLENTDQQISVNVPVVDQAELVIDEDQLVVNNKEPVLSESDIDAAMTPAMWKDKRCALCQKQFSRKAGLQEHLNRHCGTKFVCSQCEKVFYSSQRHSEHQRVHSSNLKCDICEKEFDTTGALSMHKKFHGKKMYLCKYVRCGKAFVLKADRDTHVKDHKKGNYKCRYCDKVTETLSNLHSHENMHRRLKKEK